MKTAVYRTSGDSPLVPALIECAEDGKQSVCLVELKARFDEHRNIEWSRALEEAGVHVVYGFPDLKVHAKMTLVVRREGDGLRRYVHVGTGNYHAVTARSYEDLSLFTADPEIAEDVAALFNYLTGFGRPARFAKLLVAPFGLRTRLIERIRAAGAAAAAGTSARIRIKVNALTDAAVIEELYAASQQGAQVEIVARSICMLRPGVPGLSENIRVRSIAGRFLEHSRLYGFEIGGETEFFLGSADLMTRNLDRRVEVLVPVEQARLRQELDRRLRQRLVGHRRRPGSSPRTERGAAQARQGRACSRPSGEPAAAGAPAFAPRGRVAQPQPVKLGGLTGVLARMTGMRVGVIDVGRTRSGCSSRRSSEAQRARSARNVRTSASARRSCVTGASGERSSTKWRQSPVSTRESRGSSASASWKRSSPHRDGRATSHNACSTRSAARPQPTSASSRPRRKVASPSRGPSRARAPGEGVVAVCDVGGGSTEVVVGTELLGPAWVRSVDLGSLRLTAALLPSDPPAPAEIEAAQSSVRAAFAAVEPPRPEIALATGGSARAVARIVGHEYGPDELELVVEILASRPAAASAEKLGIRPERARTLLAGALILAEVSRRARSAVHTVARRYPRRCGVPAGRPAARRLEHLVEQLDVARVREQLPRLRGRQPAQVVDLVASARTPRSSGRISHQRTRFGRPFVSRWRVVVSSSPSSQRRPVSSSISRSAQSSSLSPRIRLPLRERPVVVLGPVHDDDASVADDQPSGSSNLLYAVFASRFHAASHSSRGSSCAAPARVRAAARRPARCRAASPRAPAAAPPRRRRPGARRARPGGTSRP